MKARLLKILERVCPWYARRRRWHEHQAEAREMLKRVQERQQRLEERRGVHVAPGWNRELFRLYGHPVAPHAHRQF